MKIAVNANVAAAFVVAQQWTHIQVAVGGSAGSLGTVDGLKSALAY